MKLNLQDILHGLLLIALVITGVEPKLGNLVSAHTMAIVDVVLGALTLFVYYADVIFVKKVDVPVPGQDQVQ